MKYKLKGLWKNIIDGYNVCIFAYDHAGYGKTFTIYGSYGIPDFIPRATAKLFKIMKRDGNKFFFSLQVTKVI